MATSLVALTIAEVVSTKERSPFMSHHYQKMRELNLNDYKCPKCKGELVRRKSKKGEFLACVNFPQCKYTQGLNDKPIGKYSKDLSKKIGILKSMPKGVNKLYVSNGYYYKYFNIETGKQDIKFINTP